MKICEFCRWPVTFENTMNRRACGFIGEAAVVRTIFESLSGLEADLSRTRPPRLGLGDPIRFVLLEFGFMLGAQSLCSDGRSRVSEFETRMVPLFSKETNFDQIMLFGKRDLFVSKFAFVTKNAAFV